MNADKLMEEYIEAKKKHLMAAIDLNNAKVFMEGKRKICIEARLAAEAAERNLRIHGKVAA